MPAMESVHERTGSDAVPEEEAVVRGAILESLKERKFPGIQGYSWAIHQIWELGMD